MAHFSSQDAPGIRRCPSSRPVPLRAVLAVLLVLLPLAAPAQGGEAQARQRIAGAAQAMTSLQCDFVQTKQLTMLRDKMVAEGHMYYSQPDKLRWEYVRPYHYTFILNADRVLLKGAERSDVIDVAGNRLFREIARVMMSSVVGTCLSDDRTFTTTVATSGGEWVATMLPRRKDMRQMFQKVTLHFDQRQAVVTRVELVEKNGDLTVIDLKNIRKNETIAPRTFAVE